MNRIKKIAFSIAVVLLSTQSFGQLLGTGAYFIGDVASIGVHNRGHEGTSSIGGDHSRSTQFDASVFFGFVANPQNDGWGNYDGDFFTPGSAENGFGIEVNGINYSNNALGDNQIPGALSNYTVDGNCWSVDWIGNIAGVQIKVKYKFISTELYYTTEVTLTNNTGAPLNDLYYYRNFDPDNNVSISGDYTTTNTIVSQPTPACPKALVSATSTIPWLSYVGIASIGQQFRVTRGGFSNRDASDIWNGTLPLSGTAGSTAFLDEAISMAYKINTLPAGASETFEFVIILDDAQVDEAFAQLYSFNFTGYTGSGSVCSPVQDTAFLPCPGSSVTLSIDGPSVIDYNWVWSPATGLSSTTGSTVDAAPGSTTTYTVTGTPVNPCLSMTIQKEIVVHVGIGPLISITPPAPVCGAFDLTTLVFTDVNGIAGTTTTFHSSIPTSATDMTNLWPGTTMGSGDVVYLMIADAVGGCFDYEQIIINFSGGTNAGPNNAAALCNVAGTTIDLNTLLVGADPGTWSETTTSGQFTPATGVLDASGLAAGNYIFNFTTDVIAPCIPDVSTMTITVNQNAQAGADNATDLCNTIGATLDLNTLLSGNNGTGVWAETSASGQFTAGTGTLDASGLTAGVYTFTYTIDGTAPCTPDVANFTVNIQQEANAGADNSSTICNVAGSTIDLNTLLFGNNAVGTWLETTSSGQFNAGTGVFDGNGLTPGVYTFTYTVAGLSPCPTDVADFSITVTNLPDAGADNGTTLCNTPGATFAISTLLSGADPGGTWSETSVVPSGQFNTTTSLLNVGNTSAGTYTFAYTLTPSGPCAGDLAIFTIDISQYANAGADNAAAVCNAPGSTINLNTLLVGNNGTGFWAETTASGSFNTVSGVFNSGGLIAGNYNFTYTLPAAAPCAADVANFTIAVIDLPTAGADSAAALCNTAGSSVDLNTLLNGNNVGGIWSEVTASGQFNTTTGVLNTAGLTTGTYTFNYFVPAIGACPSDLSVFTITVNSEPNIIDLADQTHCDTYTLPAISGSSLTGNQAYYTGPNGTGVQLNPGDVITASTTLYIYDETGSTPNCFDEQSVTITINTTPVVSFIADTLSGCAPLVVNFTNTTPGAVQNCVWNFGSGGYGQVCGNIQHTYLNPGVYAVTLTLQGAGGCPNSTTYTNYITVVEQPEASFVFSPQIPDIYNSEVTFTNSSDNATHYEWKFGDGGTSTDTHTVHLYPQIGNIDYLATLYAYNDYGCVDSVTQIVTVQDVLTFFIPNTFTPDGDEFNQSFLPVFASGVDPYDFHMIIFNRWGEILFETYDYSFGWAGTYGDQGLVDDGMYIWQVEFKETMSDKQHVYRGHLTVLK